MTAFTDLELVGPLLRALEKQDYTQPTPIQAKTIPLLLAGNDVMGIAQTGSGKTAAFVLPLLQTLSHDRKRPKSNKPTAIILAPTRELASQIGKIIQIFTRGIKLFHSVVYGGAPYGPQLKQLSLGVDILVATPGRLLDHMERGTVQLDNVKSFILDEADRMLDMGFVEDVEKISSLLPEDHQTVMFSATMSPQIKSLSKSLLTDPEYVEVERKTVVANTIDHSVLNVRMQDKKDLLMHVLAKEEECHAIVFVRTKASADGLANDIETQIPHLKSSAIHGDKPQRARERTLRAFRNGRFSVLVATDVAARGIDVNGITHVINYDLPMEAENYVHRVGRTGRAGATGIAISLCEPRERNLLRNIERMIKQSITVDEDHPFPPPAPKKAKPFKKGPGKKKAPWKGKRPTAKAGGAEKKWNKSADGATKRNDKPADFTAKRKSKPADNAPKRNGKPAGSAPKRNAKPANGNYTPKRKSGPSRGKRTFAKAS